MPNPVSLSEPRQASSEDANVWRTGEPKDHLEVGFFGGDDPDSISGRGLRLRPLSDLDLPPATRWIGRGWLPRREITVLVGEEGIGKSLLWVLMAAHVSKGAAFEPFNMPEREPADVVVIVTEDSAAEVAARLQLAGADLNRIIFFCYEPDGSGSPVFGGSATEGDMLLLDALLAERVVSPALLVLDAWLDTVAMNLNVKDTQQARLALHPWKVLANRHDMAVLLLTHTNRMDTTNTRDLMGGTAALRQKARMVLFAARRKQDEDDERQHIWIGPDKSNVTGLVDAVKFTVTVEQVRKATEDDPGTTAILTAPASALMTIRHLLGEWKREEMEISRKPSRADEAEGYVLDFVKAAGGSVPTDDLKTHLAQAGFGEKAAKKAMAARGQSRPTGFGKAYAYTLTR